MGVGARGGKTRWGNGPHGLGIHQGAAQIELAGHGDGAQNRLPGAVARLFAIDRDPLVGRRLAADLRLNVQQDLIEPVGVELGQQPGEGGLAGGRKTALGRGANAQGPALVLGQAPGQLGQIFLPPRGIAEQRQQHQCGQRPDRIGFDPVAIFGERFEVFGQGAEVLALVIAAGPGFLLHRGQRRFELLGLETAPGVGEQFAPRTLATRTEGHFEVRFCLFTYHL